MKRVVSPEVHPKRKPKMYTREREKFLREHADVDPAMLADSLGVSERFVISYQRKLGIRPLTGNPPRKKK